MYDDANFECFAFLNCCNLTFSQIEVIFNFFKNFVKEVTFLNFSEMALCEEFSYHVKYYDFFVVQYKHPQKIKTRITYEIIETNLVIHRFK